jgi:hypothetical protein
VVAVIITGGRAPFLIMHLWLLALSVLLCATHAATQDLDLYPVADLRGVYPSLKLLTFKEMVVSTLEKKKETKGHPSFCFLRNIENNVFQLLLLLKRELIFQFKNLYILSLCINFTPFIMTKMW